MTQLGVRTPIGPLSRAVAQAGRQHPKAYLATVTGLKCELPIAPVEVDLGGFADTYETLDRAGRKPVVARTGAGLRTMDYELLIATQTLGESVEPVLAKLTQIAGTNSRVTFSYGRSERGLWRISRCDVTVTERAPFTNDATKATVRLAFLEAVDVVVKVGPLSGGVVRPPAKPPAAKPADRVHIVKRGDWLSKIALRYYGRVDLWPKLATVNKLRNPHLIYPGQRIRIPAKL